MESNLSEKDSYLSEEEEKNLLEIVENKKKELEITKEEFSDPIVKNKEKKRDTIRNTTIRNLQIVEDLLLNGVGTLEVQEKYKITRVGVGQSTLSLRNFNIGRKLTPKILNKTYNMRWKGHKDE